MKEQGRCPEPAGTTGVVMLVLVGLGGAGQQERRQIVQEHSVQFAEEP